MKKVDYEYLSQYKNVKKMDINQLQTYYNAMLKTAKSRLRRLKSSQFAERAATRDLQAYMTPPSYMDAEDYVPGVLGLAKQLRKEETTLRGAKNALREDIEGLKRIHPNIYGSWLNESNANDYFKLMERAREELGDSIFYFSEQLTVLFGELTERGYNAAEIMSNLTWVVEHINDIQREVDRPPMSGPNKVSSKALLSRLHEVTGE